MERDALAGYQIKAINKMRQAFDAVGFGMIVMAVRGRKTATALLLAKQMGLKSIVVLCPPAVVKVWNKEAEIEGVAVQAHSNSYQGIGNIKLQVYDLLIIDEIHMMRGYTKRTRLARKLATRCKYKLGLTGTPFNENKLEYYYPLSVLSGGTAVPSSHEAWIRAWGQPINPKATHIKYRVHPHLEDNLDAALDDFLFIHDPKKVRRPVVHLVPYTQHPLQNDIMYALTMGHAYRIGDHIIKRESSTSLAHVYSKCSQILSGFLYHDGGLILFPTKKFIEMKQLIDNQLKGKRVILWYEFIEEVEAIKDVLRGYDIAEFKKSNKRAKYLIAHPASAGAGLDLSDYDANIYITPPKSFVNHKQSEFRIAAQGGAEKDTYIMASKHTVDKRRLKVLSQREAAFKEVYRCK